MKRTLLVAAGAAFVLSACSDLQAPPASNDDVPLTAALEGGNFLDQMNADLVGYDFQVASAEIYTAAGSGEMGTTTFFSNVGNKQLGADWVPNDPRNGNGTVIPWATDGTELASGLTAAETTGAIDAAMSTWDGVQCSTIPLVNLGLIPFDYGFVQFLLGFGGSNGFLPFLTHAGWLPGAFFDAVTPGGSGSILGVTFTFTWTTPADLDGNGKADTALREIYYNDAFPWAVDGTGIDVETVALHEAGHGLSQGHFGKLFRTDKNGKFHFAPRAVMNAGYTGIQREIGKTDNAGHCSNWGAWPNN